MEDSEKNCIICLDSISKNYIINKDCKCAINIHQKCFTNWNIKNPNQCPICRNELKKNIIITINPVNISDNSDDIIYGEIINNNNNTNNNTNRFQGESMSKKKKFAYSVLLSLILFGILIGIKSVY